MNAPLSRKRNGDRAPLGHALGVAGSPTGPALGAAARRPGRWPTTRRTPRQPDRCLPGGRAEMPGSREAGVAVPSAGDRSIPTRGGFGAPRTTDRGRSA